ncbi:MAG: pyruvate, phosphate dikinase [Acidobacteria bacterium]|nr:pyruvate, phosphate dikinase [Acidobacteriota bacterium]
MSRTRKSAKPAAGHRVFSFGGGKADGQADQMDLLGGKGANLHEMTRIGIPVPPGFTLSTEICRYFLDTEGQLPDKLGPEVENAVRKLESLSGKRYSGGPVPLLLSVRSGARASMPGMMDTILNLGLNDETVERLSEATRDPRFAWDCYRRLVQMYSNVVLGADSGRFEECLAARCKQTPSGTEAALRVDDLCGLTREFISLAGAFPQDPWEQLWGAIRAVFRSWNTARAKTYRRMHRFSDSWGTAANVQTMVYGNMGPDSATGVAFSRDPANGERLLYGEFMPNAQGEDIVAGIRTPQGLRRATPPMGDSFEELMPEAFTLLESTARRLEAHFGDLQDIEFTIEKSCLYILQTRSGKRTGIAAVRAAVEMFDEGLIGQSQAMQRVEPGQLQHLLAPVFEPEARDAAAREGRIIARGLNAGPGAASGSMVLSTSEAIHRVRDLGEKVILVRTETSAEDIAGMAVAEGILTARGGMTSHAAVVARGMGKCCVTGCGTLEVDSIKGRVHAKGRLLREGDYLSIDGSTGEVIEGLLPTRPSEIVQVLIEKSLAPDDSALFRHFERLMSWADGVRRLRVRANADTPQDAEVARQLGAEGIGLCRTEHMFFAPDRIAPMRAMIVADKESDRRRALDRLLPMQREDFSGILRAMEGLPVTIRLLDPPLHEFLPEEDEGLEEVARDLGITVSKLRRKVEALREVNPMLGHRGCRLGVSYPEIYEMQVRAIYEATCVLRREGVEAVPEVMIPLVGTSEELHRLRLRAEEVAHRTLHASGQQVEVQIGTMIEVPRACLVAGEIAKQADFFSFGTNDLTQMTFGFSRDDATSFLPEYVESGILPFDPFQSIDISGVGALVRQAVEEGRQSRPGLKIGVCGEHGGDPDSVGFFHRCGLDYVSCSPYRVPVARLAAAQEALRESGEGPSMRVTSVRAARTRRI